MEIYEKALEVMKELFAKDYTFALATAKDNTPSVRFIDTYYDNGSFYVVTYLESQKVKEMAINKRVSLCNKLYRFNGIASNIGHPLEPQNKVLRETLIHVFEPWYFLHNNENDPKMCYIQIELTDGFYYKDGKGYKVNFETKEAEEFPFDFDIIPV